MTIRIEGGRARFGPPKDVRVMQLQLLDALTSAIELRLVSELNGTVNCELVKQRVTGLDQRFVARFTRKRYIGGGNDSSQEFLSGEKLMVRKGK